MAKGTPMRRHNLQATNTVRQQYTAYWMQPLGKACWWKHMHSNRVYRWEAWNAPHTDRSAHLPATGNSGKTVQFIPSRDASFRSSARARVFQWLSIQCLNNLLDEAWHDTVNAYRSEIHTLSTSLLQPATISPWFVPKWQAEVVNTPNQSPSAYIHPS